MYDIADDIEAKAAIENLISDCQKLEHDKVIIVARVVPKTNTESKPLKPLAYWLCRVETEDGFHFTLTRDERRAHTYYPNQAPDRLSDYVERLRGSCDDLEILGFEIVKVRVEQA